MLFVSARGKKRTCEDGDRFGEEDERYGEEDHLQLSFRFLFSSRVFRKGLTENWNLFHLI